MSGPLALTLLAMAMAGNLALFLYVRHWQKNNR